MNNKVEIKYNILGTGENVSVFTFDEPTEEENEEKFDEAMALIFSQIVLATKRLRKLQLCGVEIKGGPRVIIKKGAGENKFEVEILKKEEEKAHNE